MRTLTPIAAHDQSVQDALSTLADKSASVGRYRDAFHSLGKALGHLIVSSLKAQSRAAIVSTVEDADFLGRGIWDVLQPILGEKLSLNVLWNYKHKPFSENNESVAPVIREFREPEVNQANILIVIKSIISGSCVVRTNLARLIDHVNPDRILIVAPVIRTGAEGRLESEFEPHITQKFEYFFFAEDDELDGEMVVPGIGGSVYQRLGLGNGIQKNSYVPELVKQRRLLFASR